MRTGIRVLAAIGVVGGSMLLGPRAEAACHFFTVAALNTVSEGGHVNVTVERDAALADSSVLVSTVNGTAKAPGDFGAFNQRVSFTGSQTQKTIQIHTKEDTTPESAETFSVKVSEGQGCSINDDFQYGTPAKITISDDDKATAKPSTPTPAPRGTTAATPQSTATPSPTPSPSPSPEATDEPEESPTPTVTAVAVTEEDDGGFPWLPVAAVAGFLAAGGGALMLTRMRRGGL